LRPVDPSLTHAIVLPFTSEKGELMITGPPQEVLSPTQTLPKIENIWFSSIKMASGKLLRHYFALPGHARL